MTPASTVPEHQRCPTCKKRHISVYKMCDRCRQYHKEYKRRKAEEKRRAKQEQRRYTIVNAPPGWQYCSICREWFDPALVTRVKPGQSNGRGLPKPVCPDCIDVCPRCKGPNLSDHKWCAKCREYYREYYRDYRRGYRRDEQPGHYTDPEQTRGRPRACGKHYFLNVPRTLVEYQHLDFVPDGTGRKCIICRLPLPADHKSDRCRQCIGRSSDKPMTCPLCGVHLAQGQSFCTACNVDWCVLTISKKYYGLS